MAPSACFDDSADYGFQVPETSLPSPPSNTCSDSYPPLQAIITDASDWEYLGEGASNIIYRYKGFSPIFSSYLLRLRKFLPGTPSTLTLFTTLQETFVPALGADLVCPTVLARLAPGVARQLNQALSRLSSWVMRQRGAEGTTSIIGTGSIDEHEQYAMLVQDMSCGQWARTRGGSGDPADDWADVAMVEFKPRWLAQSADAPADWAVCRSCAVRGMQAPMQTQSHTRTKHHRRCFSGDSGLGMDDEFECDSEAEAEYSEDDDDDDEPHYCPLDLSSSDPCRVHRAAHALLHTSAGSVHCTTDSDADLPLAESLAPVLAERFAAWLHPGHGAGGALLSRLREAQEYWGRHGVFTEEARAVEEVGRAMAVRDCSVFVRVWVRWAGGAGARGGVESRFECRVGDLDVKGVKGGGGVYWRNVERRLMGGGWYGRMGGEGGRECR